MPFMVPVQGFGHNDSASLHASDLAYPRQRAVPKWNQPGICALRYTAVAPMTLHTMEGIDTSHSTKTAASLCMHCALVQADTTQAAFQLLLSNQFPLLLVICDVSAVGRLYV